MKYRVLPRFEKDYRRLTAEEKKQFRAALTDFIAACREYEKQPGHYIWPRHLRVEKLVGTSIMAMTWSFSGPDGRATFQFESVGDELLVIWRRVGRHAIYREP